jgi:hypothetical protein
MNPDIHKLLRLKRYEHPTPDYFERFLDEFHDRQRADLLKQPTLGLIWERIVSAFPDFHVPRLAYAGVAAAAIMVSSAILVTQQGGDTSSAAGASFALNSPGPTAPALFSAESAARQPASSRSEFPPYYVLESRPVSYESPYSF